MTEKFGQYYNVLPDGRVAYVTMLFGGRGRINVAPSVSDWMSIRVSY